MQSYLQLRDLRFHLSTSTTLPHLSIGQHINYPQDNLDDQDQDLTYETMVDIKIQSESNFLSLPGGIQYCGPIVSVCAANHAFLELRNRIHDFTGTTPNVITLRPTMSDPK